jgi:pyrophosphate--fructose-6-phosphate 1-phosphotransferase
MGRSASHITLECAFNTHPNAVLIGEEIAASNKSLEQIVTELCDLICRRSEAGKDYGIILIPEGLLEFIPSTKKLIAELNNALVPGQIHSVALDKIQDVNEKVKYTASFLTPSAKKDFEVLPDQIKRQLILDRDPHGNVPISQIETERLIIEMVTKEMHNRTTQGTFKGKFGSLPHFFGYEARSCLPSNFDANYCYSLGVVAGILISSGKNGYMAGIKNLAANVEKWIPIGIPLVSMLAFEQRGGKSKVVISKALVDLEGEPFKFLQAERESWAIDDNYCFPGPIQYFGPKILTEATPLTLQLESGLLHIIG